MSSLTHTTEHKLAGIPDAGHRYHRHPSTALSADKREEEGEYDCKQGDSGILVELGGHHNHGEDGGEEHAASPEPGGNLLVRWGGVVDGFIDCWLENRGVRGRGFLLADAEEKWL